MIHQAVAESWRDFLVKLCGRMTVEVIDPESFFALKIPSEQPRESGWPKVRSTPSCCGKLLCQSGFEALFVRPQDPTVLDDQSSDALLFGALSTGILRPLALSALLKTAEAFPGLQGPCPLN